MSYYGPIIALSCALTWSIAIVILKSLEKDLHPVFLNLFKNVLGLLCFVFTYFFIQNSEFVETDLRHALILMFSGFIGIGLADAMILRALKLIGASRLAILECAYSPSVIILSIIFFSERLGPAQIIGTIFVIAAILIVSIQSKGERLEKSRAIIWGSVFAVVGIIMMAAGILMVKAHFESYPLLWIIILRLIGGVFGSLVLVLITPNFKENSRNLWKKMKNPILWLGSFFATFISMYLWIAGYKYQSASITAVLNQMATIFTVILAALFLGEKINTKKIFATAIAVLGVIIIVLFD